MKIVFISNKLTPHQIPICNAFHQEHQFFFVETMKETTTEVGWYADGSKYPYVFPYTEDKGEIQRIHMLIMEADAVIIGSAPDAYIFPRLKSGKLTFKYAERFYKNGINANNFLRVVVGTWLHHGRLQKYPLYMLCASAYTANDCAIFGNYKNRLFKWGYFPQTYTYDLDSLMDAKEQKECVSILWVGRLLDWKHPDDAVKAAIMLKNQGYNFHMDIVGDGPMKSILQKQISANNAAEYITLLGSKTPSEVRQFMEQADIFLFTSDEKEGWGAVLNESMNSACAVVASNVIGSVPYLIRNGDNGLVYQSGDVGDLTKKVKYLLDKPEALNEIGKKAYETIIERWNADIASKRFVNLVNSLLTTGNQTNLYQSGPCSKAEIITGD